MASHAYDQAMIDRTICIVADRYGYTSEQLLGPRTERDLCKARHIAQFLCYANGTNKRRIAKCFNRGESTVRNAIERLEIRLELHSELREELFDLKDEIGE